MRTRIKFCGCTSVDDARAAVALGADAVGVIFALDSPRYVTPARAREIAAAVPAFVSLVGVVVDPPLPLLEEIVAARYMPQFSGNEPANFCEGSPGAYIKVFHIAPETRAVVDAEEFARANAPFRRATWMFDTLVDGRRGGTGRTFDWDVARKLAGARPFIMSGGLNAANVGACVRAVRPFGVDVRSGIETDGVKDPNKMRAFVRAVEEADAQA